jgi:alpha-galactosidase/6-phospho-beta-glucosidase family protein
MSIIVPRTDRWSRENSITRYIFMLIAGMLLTSMFLTSCAIPLAYHDTTTYKNLTDLKAETMMLFETFDTTPFADNEAALVDLALKFRKAYEYEKGKGIANSKTMQQFHEIQKLLNADVADYQEYKSAKLGPKYFSEAAVVLGQAFDIAIATENLKNKDK